MLKSLLHKRLYLQPRIKETNLRIPNFTNYGSHITYRFTLRPSKPNIWFYQETDFFHFMVVLIFKFLLQVFEKRQKYQHPISNHIYSTFEGNAKDYPFVNNDAFSK